MPRQPRYLLLQMRNADDPMRSHEVDCFRHKLNCRPVDILTHDLLTGAPSAGQLDEVDGVLLGGSGDYSVAQGGPWLESVLRIMRTLHDTAKPTFASCWGFQAMAAALGGRVVTDMSRAEVGAIDVFMTEAGARDPLFRTLPRKFIAIAGHGDIVEELPEGATLLASTETVANQAFKFDGLPIYCTQFHPELVRKTLLDRIHQYPKYLEELLGIPYREFVGELRESSDTFKILGGFAELVKERQLV